MTLWRVEVSIDLINPALPSPSYYDFTTYSPTGFAAGAYALTAQNMNPGGPADQQLYVKLEIVHERDQQAGIASPTDSYFTRIAAGEQNNPSPPPVFTPDPWIATLLHGDFEQDFIDSGSRFSNPGLLAIEKDTVTGDVRFITPAATISSTCGAMGITQNSELRPLSIGLLLQVQIAGSVSPPELVPQTLEISFSHLYGKQDGMIISGAAMSTTDPGMWAAWQESVVFDRRITPTFTQEATEEDALLAKTTLDTPFFGSPGSYADAWYRVFQGPDQMPSQPLDLTTMPEHNVLFGAWNKMPNHVTVRRSHNQGHTWTDSTAESMTAAESISIQCQASQVYVCYYNGTQIVMQASGDLGASWSNPTVVSISGTNPRLVIAPDGTFFFFYFSGTSLVLSRSANRGVALLDATPITITTGLTAQDFGAVLSPDRLLVVSYINSGNWESKRSGDWGLTWSLV
jgi:hypothetical protein